MSFSKYINIVIFLCFLFLGNKVFSQERGKRLDYRKTVEDADCNECKIEKKNKFCFIVISYVGNVDVINQSGGILNSLDEPGFDNGSPAKMKELHYCTTDKYQEIKVSAKNFAEVVFALTPADFKNGIPVIAIFEEGKDPNTLEGTTKTLFDKMAELESGEIVADNYEKEVASSNTTVKAEKNFYMQKTYDKSECDYCLKVNKKYKCLVVITSLKGAKLMDGEDRITHTKALRFKDSIRQYVFCFKPTEYRQFTFKAKGYQNGVVEVIPHDFSRNRTPIYTFYSEEEKSLFEGSEQVSFLYSKKSDKRWDCEDCSEEKSCIYVYSYLPNLVLNTSTEIIQPKAVRTVGSLLKQYVYCMDPNTKSIMTSQEGYEPCLLKAKFEDLESIGATAFVVADNEGDLDVILERAEEERKEIEILAPKIETPAPVVKKREFRIQMIAKVMDDSNVDKIQTVYKLPEAEVKEDYDGSWHRYTLGSFDKYEDALKMLDEFKKRNKTDDAFIVLYVDGKRVGPYNP